MKKIVLTVVAGAMMVVVMSCENKEKKAYQASVDSLQVAYDSVGKVAMNWHQQFNALFETCQADTTVSDSVKAIVFEKISTDWAAFETEWTENTSKLDSLKQNVTEVVQNEEVTELKNYLSAVDEKLVYFQAQLENAKNVCQTAEVVTEEPTEE
ncbi:hypothetical protein LVD17_10615 [Fulvivirga ulvae]|uniref:hypothetical protein n=1 Tax=Fulvivirga ulvae TaxID=2904245 RepID=UPI001F47FFA7|nr:hypothetical protein [Fulvivirga ulvae]UII34262.1 hypothetical protein LVD17_10615 [Fulvivirga ulvae]